MSADLSRVCRWLRQPRYSTLVGCACLAACSGASFAVRVRSPSGSPSQGALVRLMRAQESVCSAGGFATRRTAADGLVRFQTEWCGDAQLVVVQKDDQIALQQFDSCRATVVDVVLRARPVAHVDERASSVALRFVEALAREDWATTASLLADPTTLDMYKQPALRRSSFASFREVAPSELHVASADPVRVSLLLAYDDGCESNWDVELVTRDGELRVAELRPRDVQGAP